MIKLITGVLLVFAVIMITLVIVCGDALAYSPYSPGTVVDTYEDTDHKIDTDSGFGLSITKYIGVNAAGEYIVAVAGVIPGTLGTRVVTYKIDTDGSFLGVVDSGTISTSYLLYSFSKVWDDSDFYLIAGGQPQYVYSFQITSEGGISITKQDSVNDSYAYNSVQIMDGVVLFGTDEHVTLSVDTSDGTITGLDTWNSPDVAYNLLELEHLNNDTKKYFIGTYYTNCGNHSGLDALGLRAGVVQISDICSGTTKGDIGWYESPCLWHQSYTGTGCSTQLSKTRGGGLNNRLAYTGAGSIYAVSGFGVTPTGDEEINVELFDIPTNQSITATGEGFLGKDADVDTTATPVCAVKKLGKGNIAIFYSKTGGDGDLYMRMVWGITSSGDLNQGMISQETKIINGSGGIKLSYYRQYPTVQLGDSNLTFTAMAEDSGVSSSTFISITAHRLPPVVETTNVGHINDDRFTPYGSVTDCGSDPVTEWGFCYNTTGSPDYSGSLSYTNGAQTSPFSYDWAITGFDTSQQYYVRAYACNASGTAYGEVLNAFTGPGYTNEIFNLEFEPLQISSGTISDQSGNGHDASYIWVSNPGSLTLSYGSVNTSGWYYSGTDSPCYLFQDTPDSTEAFSPPTSRTYTGFPGMEMINTQLDNADIPQAIFWIPFLIAMILAAGFLCYKLSKDMIGMAVGSGIGVFGCVTFGWFDWWYLFAYIIPAYACVIGQRNTGGYHI